MITISPVTQRTESSCGPAVMEMLLSFWNKNVSQEDFIKTAGITEWIEKHGTQPGHMIEALKILAPDLQIWFKNQATAQDLTHLIKERSVPVAVNWQGLFYADAKQELSYPSPENGHYSVVVDIDVEKDHISLQDPYPEFAATPRNFSLRWFVERWWDIADHYDPITQTKKKLLTQNLLFIVLPKHDTYPLNVGMSRDFSSQ